jgi:hypothetical protein
MVWSAFQIYGSMLKKSDLVASPLHDECNRLLIVLKHKSSMAAQQQTVGGPHLHHVPHFSLVSKGVWTNIEFKNCQQPGKLKAACFAQALCGSADKNDAVNKTAK